MLEDLLSRSWFWWGGTILLGFPLLSLLLSEVGHRFETAGSSLAAGIDNIRAITLPLFTVYLLLVKIIGLSSDDVLVKSIQTLFWISLINAALRLLNQFFFAQNDESEWRARIPKLLLDFSRLLLVAIATAFVLSEVWGADLGRLLTALGVGSIVFGLALQDTLGGLFSGIALLSGRQVREGDWIRVDDREGRVIALNWRSVVILTRDNDAVIIPNIVMAKNEIYNFSNPEPLHRIQETVDLSFDHPPNFVRSTIIDAMLATPGVLHDPQPTVAVVSYNEFTVTYVFRFFIADYVDAVAIRDEVVSNLWYVAKRHGLIFPTRNLEVIHMPEVKNQTASRKQIALGQLFTQAAVRVEASEVAHFAADCRINDYGHNEVVVGRDAVDSSMYVILQGGATEILVHNDGHETAISSLSEGDIFGLMALFRKDSARIVVRAKGDLETLVIPKTEMWDLFDRHPRLAEEMQRTVEQRIKTIARVERKRQAKAV